MQLDSIRETYFAECVDQLAELETGLFTISSDGPDIETVNSVFRAVHSIKGGAGAFALDKLVSFAHVFENALDVIRNDLSQSSESRIDLLLRSADVLTDIVQAAKDDSEPVDFTEIAAELEKEFNLEAEPEEEEVAFDVVPISLDDLEIEVEENKNRFEISFAPKQELYLNGHDPQKIFRELMDLGECTITPDDSRVAGLERHDLANDHLSWTITLETTSLENEVQAVFEWVLDACELDIKEIETGSAADADFSIDDFLDDVSDLPEVEEDDPGLAPAPELDEGVSTIEAISECSPSTPNGQAGLVA